MCLSVDTLEASVASEDIICYKVLHYYQMDSKFHAEHGKPGTPHNRLLLSPFYSYRYYDDGNGRENFPNLPLGQVHTSSAPVNVGHKLVDKGLHTFVHRKDAEKLALGFIAYHTKKDYYVFTCIIPKGTRYFEGLFSSYPSYASDQLIVLPLDNPRSVTIDGLEL